MNSHSPLPPTPQNSRFNLRFQFSSTSNQQHEQWEGLQKSTNQLPGTGSLGRQDALLLVRVGPQRPFRVAGVGNVQRAQDDRVG